MFDFAVGRTWDRLALVPTWDALLDPQDLHTRVHGDINGIPGTKLCGDCG